MKQENFSNDVKKKSLISDENSNLIKLKELQNVKESRGILILINVYVHNNGSKIN